MLASRSTLLQEYVEYGRVRLRAPISEMDVATLAGLGIRPSEVFATGAFELQELELLVAYEQAWTIRQEAERMAKAAAADAKRSAIAHTLAELFP